MADGFPRKSDGALVARAAPPSFACHAYGSGSGGGGGGGGGPPKKTARDLQREIKSRAKRRSDVHKPVLEQLRKRICSKAALDHVRLVYRVPDFLPGLPRYDVSDVARSVLEALVDDGFLVELFEPDTLYVSWDRSEGRQTTLRPGETSQAGSRTTTAAACSDTGF